MTDAEGGVGVARDAAEVRHGGKLRLRLRPPANQVNRKAILWWTLGDGIGWAVLVVAGLVVMFFVRPVPVWLIALESAVVLVAVVDVAVGPRLRYRYHRWETTDEAVYVQYGVVFQDWRVAPLSRVQTVDTERGPLQQWLGLSTVTVTTASAAGPLKIRGLARDDAAALVDELTAVTAATPGDAT